MDTQPGTTSPAGNWVALAGVLVLVFNHFGINVVPSDIEAIFGGVVAVIGIYRAVLAHYNLKTIAGIK